MEEASNDNNSRNGKDRGQNRKHSQINQGHGHNYHIKQQNQTLNNLLHQNKSIDATK